MAGQPDILFDAQSFGSPFSDHPVVAQGGRTAFQGFLTGPSITPENGHALWTYAPGAGLHLLARAGDSAPGKDGQSFVSFPEPPAINDRGDVTFLAFVQDIPHEASEADDVEDGLDLSLGIWTARDGEFTPRLHIGDTAPIAHQQAVFSDFGRPLMNGRGDIAVMAAIQGPEVSEHESIGIWTEGPGDNDGRLVARGGMHAPGAPDEAVFHAFLEPSLNNAGQVAFLAALAGPGISDAEQNVLGLWGQDRSGTLRMVVRTGEYVAVAPGDLRLIEAIAFASGSGGQDGRPRGLNDHGQIALRVRFADGTSAVLVSDVLSVTEPSNIGLGLTAIILLAGLRPSRLGSVICRGLRN
jgi:hypothetical protein